MGKICRNLDGSFVIFGDETKPEHCLEKEYTVKHGSYNNYYNDYEEIRHYTGRVNDIGRWKWLDFGISIAIENVPEKYLDMTYDSEPRII